MLGEEIKLFSHGLYYSASYFDFAQYDKTWKSKSDSM